MSRKIILFLLFTFVSFFSFAQTGKIDPERPDQSESPDLVRKNIFQAEFGFNKENNFESNYDILSPTALFKYGFNKIELRLEAAYRNSYEHLIPNPKWENGLDPISL